MDRDPRRRHARYTGEGGTGAPALEPPRRTGLAAVKSVEKELAMKKTLSFALVGMLSLALAAPASAGRGHGGGFQGGSRGGFQSGGFQSGGFHHGGFHRGGFHRFGCCFGPAFVGGVFVGSPLAYPYYAYPYPYPVYYPEPVYVPAPAYQPQPQLSVAPSVQREVCYVAGCYRLQGDGVTVAYRWVWIPTVPEPPPAPPTAPPGGPPAPSGLVPADPASSHPTQQLYRWIDEQGVATWTNSGEAVPDRYRTQPKRSLSF